MSTQKKKRKRPNKRVNTDHIAHQVGVSGIGFNKDKKKVIPRKKKYKDDK